MFIESEKISNGKVGYMGPVNSKPDPSYEDVCSSDYVGQTGQ